MKHVTSLLCLLFATLAAFGQENSEVAVKSGTAANGVVIVTIEEGGKTLELQCNQGLPDCTIPQVGKYQMVRLPKNRGYYDCKCVQLYQKISGEREEKKIGEYCLL